MESEESPVLQPETWRVLAVEAQRRKTEAVRLRQAGPSGWKRWVPVFRRQMIEMPGAALDMEDLAEQLQAALELLAREGWEPWQILPMRDRGQDFPGHPVAGAPGMRSMPRLGATADAVLIIAKRKSMP